MKFFRDNGITFLFPNFVILSYSHTRIENLRIEEIFSVLFILEIFIEFCKLFYILRKVSYFLLFFRIIFIIYFILKAQCGLGLWTKRLIPRNLVA